MWEEKDDVINTYHPLPSFIARYEEYICKEDRYKAIDSEGRVDAICLSKFMQNWAFHLLKIKY